MQSSSQQRCLSQTPSAHPLLCMPTQAGSAGRSVADSGVGARAVGVKGLNQEDQEFSTMRVGLRMAGAAKEKIIAKATVLVKVWPLVLAAAGQAGAGLATGSPLRGRLGHYCRVALREFRVPWSVG